MLLKEGPSAVLPPMMLEAAVLIMKLIGSYNEREPRQLQVHKRDVTPRKQRAQMQEEINKMKLRAERRK